MSTAANTSEPAAASDRWQLAPDGRGIVWNVAADTRLPHSDHIEMSGRKVSVIVRYVLDADRRLSLTREVIWPALRIKAGDVRGYLRRTYGDELTPQFTVDGQTLTLGPVRQVRFVDGVLRFLYADAAGLTVERSLFPSRRLARIVETWTIHNNGPGEVTIGATPLQTHEETAGVYGAYRVEQALAAGVHPLAAGHTYSVSLLLSARRADDAPDEENPTDDEAERLLFAERLATSPNHLHLSTPDPLFDTAFALAKLRAAESLFDTQMGLVHSPGGGRYYGGVWANDQAEYSGPLFGLLNDADASEAALNAYRSFGRYMTTTFRAIPSSLEMEGTIPWSGAGDRGDAAMIAGGASRYALARGDRAIAEELWPIIAWCLEYCQRRTNAAGIVESDSDELEGRFPTGSANLSTSCLACDGYRRGADVARSLGKMHEAAEYERRADALADAIERCFGATVEGYVTYRYYDGNTTLRAWICLPLVFDLAQGARRAGTIDALFSPRLWTADGVATEAGDTVFWDRSTLYALRGVFRAGATEAAFAHLAAYTRRRLLGEHVPYPVEAHPEGGQAHLSAESALYCRIFTEGLLGLTPTGLHAFTLAPYLPAAWPFLELSLTAFGHPLRIRVDREAGDVLRVGVLSGGDALLDATGPAGTRYTITIV